MVRDVSMDVRLQCSSGYSVSVANRVWSTYEHTIHKDAVLHTVQHTEHTPYLVVEHLLTVAGVVGHTQKHKTYTYNTSQHTAYLVMQHLLTVAGDVGHIHHQRRQLLGQVILV